MMRIHETASACQPASYLYLKHQRSAELEEAVGKYMYAHRDAIQTDLIYLPIYWTNLYWARGHGTHAGFRAHADTQQILDSLDPSLRYFTVVQNDEGLFERPPPNVLVFAAGGQRQISEYPGSEVNVTPVPLACDPHPCKVKPRTLRSSFVGVLDTDKHRGNWRARMAQIIGNRPGYAIRTSADAPRGPNGPLLLFEDHMNRSKTALCPRGNGRTSFRLYESMQMGAVPVYIYSEPWLPYADRLDWREFCILVGEAELPNLVEIIEAKTDADIQRMQAQCLRLWPEFFSIPGTIQQIVRHITLNG